MSMSEEQLFEAIVDGGGVSKEDFARISKSREAREEGIDGALVSAGLITEAQIGQLIADWFGVAHIDLGTTKIPSETLLRIPTSFARKKMIIPVLEKETHITVTSADPKDILLQALLEKYIRKEVIFAYSTPREIKANLSLFQKDPKTAFELILQNTDAEAAGETTIQLVDAFFTYAYNARASDIHIEPEEKFTTIRFRVDGILQDITEIPKTVHEGVITRLKVLSKLATDEHRAAQDGRIGYKNEFGEKIDVRLSIVPTTKGEKAVMRLLSDKAQRYSLKDLGMNERDLSTFKETITRPWGMILVTGPTGSGKTTTLYAALKRLNRREVNIATIEDPVEFDIDGVSQIQVNPKTNLTFAKGLRSIVRQDPDIIMVGEIRDGETADIAVNAAMTGHLVLSTLHTNDAATTFPRIKDMGVEDFLVSSTVLMVIAQRLVRKICLKCIRSVEITEQEMTVVKHLPQVEAYLKEISGSRKIKGTRMFRGKGCNVCKHTGYVGRTGIFEVLVVTDTLREAIMENRNADQIKEIAVKEGMKPMLFDGIEKVLTGITTLEEVLRVTQD